MKVIFLPTIFYIAIGILLRFLGKREIGELGIYDLIILLMISDIAVVGIEDSIYPFYYYLLGIIVLCILSKIIGFISLKSKKVRDSIDGSYSIIVHNGKINIKEMQKNLYNIDDLLCAIRKKEINYISDIKLAVLESDGTLSVYKKDNLDIPLPVISSGKIEKDNLTLFNKTEDDINKELNKRNVKLSDVFFAYYKSEVLIIIEKV